MRPATALVVAAALTAARWARAAVPPADAFPAPDPASVAHSISVTLDDGETRALHVLHDEVDDPIRAVRRFGRRYGLWSEDRQQILDGLCAPRSEGGMGLSCARRAVPSLADYLHAARRTDYRSARFEGGGSGGPDAEAPAVVEAMRAHHAGLGRRAADARRLHARPLRPGAPLPLPPEHAAWGGAPAPTLTRATDVDGLELFVVDGAVPPGAAGEWARELEKGTFRRTEGDTRFANENGFRAWVAEMSIERLLSRRIFWRMQRIVDALFPEEVLTPNRVYCNACQYGDTYFTHRDYDAKDRAHVSLIYYANAEWPHEYQGETVFYSDLDDTDAVAAVTPRPGRVAVFRGCIPHRSAAPSRLRHGPRFTWVFKYTSLGLRGDPGTEL
jgi:hypothetical protein